MSYPIHLALTEEQTHRVLNDTKLLARTYKVLTGLIELVGELSDGKECPLAGNCSRTLSLIKDSMQVCGDMASTLGRDIQGMVVGNEIKNKIREKNAPKKN